MLNRSRVWMSLAALGLVLGLGRSQARADVDGDAALAKLVKAYAALPGYVSEVKFENIHKEGGWTTTQMGLFRTGLDRQAAKLKYERPDMLLVSADGRLKVMSNQVQGRYIDIEGPEKLTYEQVHESFASIAPPPAVDLALLLSPDPMEEIFRGLASSWAPLRDRQVKEVRTLKPDDQKRPGIEAQAELGTVTLRTDPETGLVSQAVFERRIPPEAAKAGISSRLVYSIVASPRPPAADEKPWAFDAAGMVAVDSMRNWVQDGDGERDPAEGMVGKPAPAVTLKKLEGGEYSLANEKAKVVVLDFWATWCGPCAAWMPQLEEVAAWAKENKLDVAIYTVNKKETPEQINNFIAMTKLKLPVLMDSQGSVSDAFLFRSIPATVVISGGKIAGVHLGVGVESKAELKREIRRLLAAGAK